MQRCEILDCVREYFSESGLSRCTEDTNLLSDLNLTGELSTHLEIILGMPEGTLAEEEFGIVRDLVEYAFWEQSTELYMTEKNELKRLAYGFSNMGW